jgi:type II secretory pathway component PulM
MTGRDRMVIIVIGVLVVLGACWMLVVSPERKQAATLGTQVGAASAQLATAESQVASARDAQAKYAAAYASIVSLGKAVPASPEVPALVYQIAQASNQKNVEFSSITTAGASSTSDSSSATAAAAAATAAASFSEMPFTFVFNGTFEDLYHLFQQLDHFTVRTASGHLTVSGRLLTIQSVKLTPALVTTSSGQSSGKHQVQTLQGTITATAYVLPPSQGLTAGATTGAPAGAAPAASAPASSSSASSAAAPAVARVTP